MVVAFPIVSQASKCLTRLLSAIIFLKDINDMYISAIKNDDSYLYRVCEGQSDCKRETFWHGNHQDSDTNDDKLDIVVDVEYVPF